MRNLSLRCRQAGVRSAHANTAVYDVAVRCQVLKISPCFLAQLRHSLGACCVLILVTDHDRRRDHEAHCLLSATSPLLTLRPVAVTPASGVARLQALRASGASAPGTSTQGSPLSTSALLECQVQRADDFFFLALQEL